MKKKLSFLFLLAFLSISLSTFFATKGFGQQMGYTEVTQPVTLNPLYMEDVVSFRFLSLIYSRLWKRDSFSKPIPHLLVSLDPESISSDGLRYTFRIKNHVAWHSQSGSSANANLTAEDVEFTFNLIRNSKTPTIYRELSHSTIIQNIKAIGDDLIEVTLRNSLPKEIGKEVILGKLNFAILPRHGFSNSGHNIEQEESFGKKIVIGTGPYLFIRYNEEARHYLLKRYLNYLEDWKPLEAEKQRIDFIIMRHVPDENVAIFLLLTDRGVQLIPDTRPTDWAQLKKPEIITPYQYNARGFMYIGYNCTKEPFNDVRVRQALSYAIDRKNMLEVIYGKENVDEKRIQYGPFPLDEGDADLHKKIQFENPSIAQNEAKRLLEEAGFVASDGDGILERNREKLTFQLMVYARREDERRVCERYQAQLLAIGVVVNIVYEDKDAWLKKAYMRDFDALFGQWLFNEDTDIVTELFTPDGGHNFCAYNNQEVNELVRQNEFEFDPVERQKRKNRLDNILAEECPYTFLFSIPKYAAVKTALLGGVVIDPYYFFDHITNWYLKDKTGNYPE